ncbi:MAG TPA: inositol monophosphatase family protein [Prolixibacteraceae bacterium]|jgi:myo-inositol-1(or 4)-monophosphatase|nr:inositol monophosphatase family protein [Prolixibacteraceae bacterium]HOY52694.1 inositol monophosphatase family protein [Prolixibacteraceae bacterium]HPJ79325.1 inositol monophosphatase family protein [Prolixibacteraceae bacterium]HRV90010.1 inositol monophosphatase family protein [Prolixibacteraceae bacterium]
MDYRSIADQMEKVAREAGRFIVEERRKLTRDDVETKSQASFVTYVDKSAEQRIVERLRMLLPDAGFVTEEGTAGASGENLQWIIDPLDGTTNYIHGLYPCSVSIGLLEGEEVVAGVVYELGHDEMFKAWKGSPAFLNGREIKVATSVYSVDTLIGTGFPYYDFDRIDSYIAALKELMRTTRGLRRMGSAAVDLCYVAAGRFDAFFEHALHAWDVAAGAFILRQAGGKVSDFNGGTNWLFGGEIIAASNAYYPEFFAIIHQHLGTKA